MRAALARLALALVVFIGAVVALFSRGDGPLPNDADLIETAPAIADHENGYITLSAASELLVWPDDGADDQRWIQLSRGVDWQPSLAGRAIAANERALLTYSRAARAPAFQTPPIRDIANDPVPDMLPWLQLSRVSAIRSIAAAKRGDDAAAREDALLSLKMARLISSDANATLIHAMAAFNVGSSGLDALAAALPSFAPDRDQARDLAAQIGAHRTDGSAWRRMWAGEYRAMKSTVLGCCNSQEIQELTEEDPAPRLVRWLPDRYLYQPNNSLRAYAAQIRERRERAEATCSPEPQEAEPSSALSFLVPNYLGKRAAAEAADLARFETRRCYYDTRIEAMRAAIAVRAFEVERGALPPSLAALVPQYLASVPRDGFSGDELRFDRSRRLLYSVGSDGIDEGGHEIGNDTESREPRFELPAP